LNYLHNLNVLCLPALGAFDDIELNALAFLKRTEAVALDGGVMNEHVIPVCAAQKAETLSIVKPLHCSLFHCLFLINYDVPLNAIPICLRVEQHSQNKQVDQIEVPRPFLVYHPEGGAVEKSRGGGWLPEKRTSAAEAALLRKQLRHG
jgi:hypothetical protein